MKSYDVLFAVDVPHYGVVTVEAANDIEAVTAARGYWKSVGTGEALEPAYDPAWDCQVCERIVSIEDADGTWIARDIHLGSSFLRWGGAAGRRLCDAAPELLAEAIKAVALMERAGIGFNEAGLRDAIAKAGGAS